jgi:3-oxoadipate enol-lactonase
MHTLSLSPGIDLAYHIDDFTDPWTSPETIICLHGLAEGSIAWRAWVPTLGRHYRIVRPDQRGFADSTPMPESFDWSLDIVGADLLKLMDNLQLPRVHLVSAKFGGTVGMRFAAKHPDRVSSLSVVSSPVSLRKSLGTQIPWWKDVLAEKDGVRKWAGMTMAGRLGSKATPEATAWWTDLMGAAPASTVDGIMRNLVEIDVTQDLPNIRCPTLIATTTGSGLGSVDSVREWQRQIPNSELVVLDSDSYHVAAAEPDKCAGIVLRFLKGLN